MTEMPPIEDPQYAAMRAAFKDGALWTSPESELLDHLRALTTGSNHNPGLITVDINRALTIHSIMLARGIEESRKRNDWLMKITIALGALTFLAAFANLVLAFIVLLRHL